MTQEQKEIEMAKLYDRLSRITAREGLRYYGHDGICFEFWNNSWLQVAG